jgi:hypothetical protein
MNPIGASILLVILVVIATGTRRVALLGVMAGVLYLTQSQGLEIAGFNIFATRFVEVIAFARVVARREFVFRNLTTIDRGIVWLYVFTTVVFLIRSSVDFAYQIGVGVDALLLYFALRGLIDSFDAFQQLLRDFVILLVPFTLLVIVESVTMSNPFALLGATSAGDWVREGRVRCYGSFRHPSLLGTLGATLVPLYLGLWFTRSRRLVAASGIFQGLIIVWASNSGGPLNCLFFGILAWLVWPFRHRMRVVRWGIVVGIIALALIMKAPIWYIPARVSAFTGGTGWHRSYLMDMAAQHFGQWGLAGMAIRETGAWFPYQLTATGGADITNQFLSFGISAGAGAIYILIVILVRSYRSVGNCMSQLGHTGNDAYLVWGLGAVLTAHIGNWIGISYFDQTIAIWFVHLSAIASLATWQATTAVVHSDFAESKPFSSKG